MGRPHGELAAGEFATGRRHLAETAFAALADLRERHDVVVCEGAGSPSEINLRATDLANMGLAQAAQLPVIVVGDIDRGGVLAAMFGTLALLSAADQALVAGWVVNKFRGDVDLLRPGLATLERLTGRPVLGVLPWLPDVWLDAEDALAIAGWADGDGATLRVAVVRLPRVSNATDVDALAAEPGVSVSVTADPDAVAAADVAVLPGTRATVDDLAWLRERGLDQALAARARQGRPVVGICGGYQMLAQRIDDTVESRRGTVPGLGLLPTVVTFHPEKRLGTVRTTWRGEPVSGYRIHHGVAALDGAAEPFLDGWRSGSVWGTTWHGIFENDGFRRAWLAEAARQAGVPWRPEPGAPGFADLRAAMLDRLADAVEAHLDTAALVRLIEHGAPPGLPFVPPGMPE
jgi:adenosylcobyric acid synthase